MSLTGADFAKAVTVGVAALTNPELNPGLTPAAQKLAGLLTRLDWKHEDDRGTRLLPLLTGYRHADEAIVQLYQAEIAAQGVTLGVVLDFLTQAAEVGAAVLKAAALVGLL